MQQFAAAPATPTLPTQGYQEVAAPGAFTQPGYGQPAQPTAAPQGYGQTAPIQQAYPQPQPAVPQYQNSPLRNAPLQNAPLNYGVQPAYPQPGPAAAPMNPIMTVPQGPIMQVPQGQAYFLAPQNTAPGYAMPAQQPIAGTHAVWQQNAGQPVGRSTVRWTVPSSTATARSANATGSSAAAIATASVRSTRSVLAARLPADASTAASILPVEEVKKYPTELQNAGFSFEKSAFFVCSDSQ
ncbi:MAG: hypothetical protein P8M20_03750 [Planctomycetaceae bacterium]|nr:hypothetical protein [Planctomycetaceae bacterium]